MNRVVAVAAIEVEARAAKLNALNLKSPDGTGMKLSMKGFDDNELRNDVAEKRRG